MNSIEVLVISNKLDFTSDYICVDLKKKNIRYLRINRDQFDSYKIFWDINNCQMNIEIDDEHYVIDDSLCGVYYRAPVYIRYYQRCDEYEQLYKSQWMAFIKNLMFFENASWINNPQATYKAENKMLQLKYAKEIGFKIPQTYVINSDNDHIIKEKNYVIKSIDTLFLRYDNKEAFLYSTIVNGQEIKNSKLSSAPIVVQELLEPKEDIRVTVVSDKIFAVKITVNNSGIKDDWRKQKENVQYIPIKLPLHTELMCKKIVKKLGLQFGGIDLIYHNEEYYFIEINPTGEWAWLVENTNYKIYEEITNVISNKVKN